MSRLAFELDDRTLAVAQDGIVLHSAPSVVFDGRGGEQVGADAWHAQRRIPTHVSSRHFAELADGAYSEGALATATAEIGRRLQGRAPENATAWIASPARFGTAGLAAVLAVVRRLGFRVAGFVDAATATTGALAPGHTALVLEIGLHHVAVTAVDSGDAQARRRRAAVGTRGGLLELYEAWLDLVRAAMVKRTRFDPLHDAASEQQVFDALPALAREAAAKGSATTTVAAGQEQFDAVLSRDQFVRAAEPVYGEIVRLLRDLRHAGAPVTIVAPRLVFDLPGLREALDTFRNSELTVTADGFAAVAATLLELAPTNDADSDTVGLIRRVPVARATQSGELTESMRLGTDPVEDQQASHVLYDGRAFALGRGPLAVGRVADADGVIALPEGLAGVSRRHCTFVHDGEHLVLVDHSAFGTFVNGERVAERVRVRTGDRVRIGEPGVELSLIAVGA